jgi:hypothetical protein
VPLSPSPPPLTITTPATIPPPNPAPGSMWMGEPDQNGNARQCPSGTVAKYRPTAAQIVAAGGLSAYKQSHSQRLQSCSSPGQSPTEHDCYLYSKPPPQQMLGGQSSSYEHAVGINVVSEAYWGLLTFASVYNPTPAINNAGDQGASQFWLQAGSCENWFNTISGGHPNECTTGTPCGCPFEPLTGT